MVKMQMLSNKIYDDKARQIGYDIYDENEEFLAFPEIYDEYYLFILRKNRILYVFFIQVARNQWRKYQNFKYSSHVWDLSVMKHVSGKG